MSRVFARKLYELAGRGNRKKRMPLCNAEDRDFIPIRKNADFRLVIYCLKGEELYEYGEVNGFS